MSPLAIIFYLVASGLMIAAQATDGRNSSFIYLAMVLCFGLANWIQRTSRDD